MNGVEMVPRASTDNAWKKSSSPGTGAVAAGTQIKTGAGRVRKIRVTNHGAAAMYFQLFDAIALPTTTTTVADDRQQVGIGLTAEMDYGVEGISCALGIVIAASSTASKFTVIGTADADYMIEWL